ncbi:MAG: ABC transporter permease [Austwickia sp.]|nr:ABC transporter permease [Actinomycetota bacterium]MCB1252222.1 ABC transporter permease [Austwickia sp.]
MGTVLLLARRTVRRQRLQLATTLLLVALAAMMINLGVIAATDYPAAQRGVAERLHTADLQVHGADRAAIASVAAHLRHDPRVQRVDERADREAWGSVTYNGGTTPTNLVFFVPDEHTDLGRSDIVESAQTSYADPVWLPYIYKVGGGYRLGDAFPVTIGQTTRTFRVQGFFENPSFGMMTMGYSGLGVTQAQLDALGTGSAPVPPGTVLEVRTVPGERADAVATAAMDQVKAEYVAKGLEPPQIWSEPYDLVEVAAMTGARIYAVSLVAFALLIALVVMVVVRFVIRTAVLQDMTAIGTLSAGGVTAAQSLAGIALPMVATAAAGSAVGVATSYGVLPGLRDSLIAQTGIRWSPGVSPLGAAAAILLLVVAAAVTAGLAARQVRRVSAVQAVRGGEDAHSFRRTVLPLATTRGHLGALLGVKQALQHASQNAMVAVVIALVTVAGIFSAALYTDVIGSRAAFTRIMIGDLAPVQVQLAKNGAGVPEPAARADLLRQIEATPGVRKAFPFDVRGASAGGVAISLAVTQDFGRQDDSSIYVGREPRHDNEIAIGGRLAERIGHGVGDTISVEVGGARRDYLVTGLLSTVQFLGMKAELTTDGYRRLIPAYQPDYVNVYLNPGTTVAQFRDALAATETPAARSQIASVVDSADLLSSQIDVYIEMCGYLAVGILVGTAVVICLVIGLVTATMIVRTRRSLGVRKALGFTTAQLVGQTVMTYLPVVVVGSLLGAGLGLVLVEPALVGLLRSAGIMALSLTIQPYVVGGLVLAIVVLATALIVAQAGRIRRITPYRLFQDA